jgi:hypothetical protein
MHQASSRAPERATSPLAEFHELAGHAGPAAGCQHCADQLAQQRRASGALRAHQRRTRQHIDTILLAAICAGCAQAPCVCTDEAVDLILEADALGLYTGGFDDSPEGWSE